MSANKKYWVDLTDLITWTGNYTGIPRTIFSVAKEYSQRDDAGFFWYDERSHSFYEVDFSTVIPVATTDDDPVEVEKSFLEKYLKVVVSAKNIYAGYVPTELRKRITPVARPILRKSFYGAKALKESFTRTKGGSRDRLIHFLAGDTVIIIGAGWGKPTIINDLSAIKKHTAIRIAHFVHDMIPVYHPQFFGPGFPRAYTEYMFDALSVSDVVLTNSEASKKDILKFLQETSLSKKPVTVVRLSDVLESRVSPKRPPILPDGDFILCIGTIEVRKNHRLLYQTYKLAKLQSIKLPRLVIVGRPGWLVDDLLFEVATDPDIEGDIVILNGVTDAQLVWLYENCRFTVYPSVYEGWGMPIAESLVYGKVCISSNTSSMPEIAGDLIDYFAPFDAQTCLDQIVKYSSDKELLTKQSQIKAMYKSQTWHSTYLQIHNAIDKSI